MLRKQLLRSLRMLRARLLQHVVELITLARKLSEAFERIKVDEVIGLLRVFERWLNRRAPPARFGSKILDLIRGFAQKLRHAGRNRFGGDPVDVAMSFVSPRAHFRSVAENKNGQRTD